MVMDIRRLRIYSSRLLWSMVMGKIRKWLRNWFDRQIEKSLQRQANRLFDKAKIQYRDGDNT
jgi:hypothetical protein